MAKQLNDILKGVKKSTVSKLTTGKDPGVDYADKMPDTRDFVAKHSIEKHEDRVGNGPDVYNGAKQTLSTSKEKRHGYNSTSDNGVYEAAMCETCKSKNCSCDDMDDKPVKGGKGKKLLLDLAKKPLKERHMTAADKNREEDLKDKYDDSGMKQSMIKQYGPEKGKQIYFATIRKKAMKAEQAAPADTTITFPSNGVGDTGRV